MGPSARRHTRIVLAIITLLFPSSLLGQVNTGAIYGTVTAGGSPVPGATVTIVGAAAPVVATADERGEFRALPLAPGAYRVAVTATGYWPAVYDGLLVEVGRSVTIDAALAPATELVTVTAAPPPLLDRRGVVLGTQLDQSELERLPTARDAWEAARQAPGVLVDRVNIAGNESTEPSAIAGPGYAMTQQAWAVDGVIVTDSVTPGIAASFFDFDAFQQVQVSTGGSDVRVSTGGAINLVTRRGTNIWSGSARLLATTARMQSRLDVPRAKLAEGGAWNLGHAQRAIDSGNRIDLSRDAGVEAGGPILRDRMWVWAAYGRQDIDTFTIGAFREASTFNAVSAKADGLVRGVQWQGLFMRDRRLKVGRNVGPLRPPETAWDFPVTTSISKVDASRTVRDRHFVTGAVSYVQEDLAAEPAGGRDTNAVLDPDGIWRGSFVFGRERRPQVGLKGDTRTFLTAGRFGAEIHGGVDHRLAWTNSFSQWPGAGGVIGLGTAIHSIGVPLGVATVGGHNEDDRTITALYTQATITRDRLTLNIGARADWQRGSNRAATLPSNPLLPELLPGLTFDGLKNAVSWRSITPKLGIVYALDGGRSTLLKASYRQFPDELSLTDIQHSNPTRYQPGGIIGVAQSATFVWLENGDFRFSPNEIGPVVATSAIDPTRQNFFPNRIDAHFRSPRTDELIVGVDRDLGQRIVASIDLNWHRTTHVKQSERLVFDDAAGPRAGTGRRHAAADYVPAEPLVGALPDGTSYTVPVYRLRPGVTWLGGSELTNGQRQQRYLGWTASIRKRFDDSWMVRGWVNVNRWTWNVPDSESIDRTAVLTGEIEDGSAVVQDTAAFGGLKTSVFINGQWSVNAAGLYRVAATRRWSFDVAADVYGRQGYPIPYFRAVSGVETGDGIERRVRVAPEVDTYRNDTVVNVNLRFEKAVATAAGSLALSVDVFNVLNRSSVLQRQHELNLPVGDHVIEVVNPRALRLGARLRWN